jgi:hypothetical protein
MPAKLPIMASALWWGSLSVVGFLVVPMLFAHLPSPSMAGQMAARLFAAQTWVSVVCCVLLLLFTQRRGDEEAPAWASAVVVFVVGGLLLALLVQFGAAPRIVARENLRVWHTVGSLMYFTQWLCAAITLWRLAGHVPKR